MVSREQMNIEPLHALSVSVSVLALNPRPFILYIYIHIPYMRCMLRCEFTCGSFAKWGDANMAPNIWGPQKGTPNFRKPPYLSIYIYVTRIYNFRKPSDLHIFSKLHISLYIIYIYVYNMSLNPHATWNLPGSPMEAKNCFES